MKRLGAVMFSRSLGRSLALALAFPLACACSFLLDFQELQAGQRDGGSGGGGYPSGNLVGSAGSVGDASMDSAAPDGSSDASSDGALACATNCDDSDPCTTDSCITGQCVSTATVGIVEDGFSETVAGNNIYRSALVAGTDRFYLAAYGNFTSGQDIAFYTIPGSGTAWTPGPRALELAQFGSALPISPPALVWNEANQTLTAYFATGPSMPTTFLNAGQVQRAELSADLQPGTLAAVSTDTNYRYLNNTLGPAAAQIPGGDAFVAWAGAPPATGALGAGIYIQSGTTPLPAAAKPQIWDPTDLRGLAAIHGLGGNGTLAQPGVVWMSQRAGANQVDTRLQLLGNALSQTFAQCNNSGVQGVSVTTSRAHVDGFWFSGWTKEKAGEYGTEMTAILCTDPSTCLFNPTCGDQQAQLASLRNPKIATYHRLSDDSKVAHQALVASVVNTTAAKTSIVLLVQRFSLENADAGGGTTQVGSLDLAEAGLMRGPDWPEVAVIEPDKVAVSWVEYGASTDSLHVARYRVCYGD